jgi:LPXTG-motif cell wall-anchored protein
MTTLGYRRAWALAWVRRNGRTVSQSYTRSFFDLARGWASAVMLAAGAAAILGSTLDWATITVRPELQPGSTFEGEVNRPEAPEVSRPFTGLEAGDGWWSVGGGAILVLAAALLYVRRRAIWGWAGLLGSILIGSVGIADYRGIGDLSSSISHRMDIVGQAAPALGLMLVVAAAIVGVVASVAGIAASPRAEVRTSA